MNATGKGPEALLREAVSGDGAVSRAALTELLSRLYPRLLAYVSGLAGRDRAEDTCQETMVRIVTSLPRFRPRAGAGAWASFQAWAFTIAGNVFKDSLRKSVRVTPVAEVEAQAGVESSRSAEAEALEGIGEQRLMAAVKVLSLEHRQVFLLKAYYGYSYEEIARIVGCPVGTAKSRLHHAVKTLRDELKGSGAS